MLAPSAGAANLATPIKAVFLKESSRPDYTMVAGQLLFFENTDPFLSHGISGGLTTAIADPGKDRMVRGSPYLGPGVYPFFDPLHPEMQAKLTVTPGVAPPPDVTAPSSKFKLLHTSAKKLQSKGRLRMRLTPSEAVDTDITVKIDGEKSSTTAAFADPVTKVIVFQLTPKQIAEAVPGARVIVKGRITDVMGQTSKLRERRTLGSGGGKKKKK